MARAWCRGRFPRLFSTLRFRLMVLILLTLLPAFGLVLYSASEQRRLASIQAQENALRVARAAVGRQEQLVQAEHQFLAVLAQLVAARNTDLSACSQLLADVMRDHEWYQALLIVAPNGKVVSGAGSYRQDIDFSDHHLFRRAMDFREFALGEYRVGALSGKGLFAFGYPILDASGRVAAVLVSVLDVRALNQVASQSLLPPGSTLTAIDRNGLIVTRYPDPDEWLGRSVPEAPIMEAIRQRQGEGTVEAIGEDGVARLYAFAPLPHMPDQDMFVSVGIPTAVAFADAQHSLVRSLLALAVVALLALAMAWGGATVLYARPMGALLSATQRLASGDWGARAGLPRGMDELSQLAGAFDRMAETLAKRDVERREEAQARARLLHQVISAQEDERKRIARELHDETSQSLVLLIADLELGRSLASCDPARADEHLRRAKATADAMLDSLHQIIADLRPPLLDDLGLPSAIAAYAKQRLGPAGISAQLCDQMPDLPVPPDVATALFRIAQEALNNVVKHAHATRVAIALAVRDGALVLTVEDNGTGFQVPAAEDLGTSARGFGLLGMQERASILGAEFDLQTAPGQGTVVTVRVPLPKEKADVEDSGSHR